MDVFNRLKDSYTKEPPSKPPALSANAVVALSVTYVLLFVVPFYLDKNTRPSATLTRDAPSVIRARLRAVSIASVTTVVITLYILSVYGKYGFGESLHHLGLWPVGLHDIAKVLLLCMILFVGPLFESYYVESSWRELISGSAWRDRMDSLIWWRNIVVAPLLEEAVFRSSIVPLHLLTYATVSDMHNPPNYANVIYITPLYFGIAHIHHFYEFRLTHPRVPLIAAVLRSVIQMAYTTLFGMFAVFILLRTGSFWACCAAHAFCNSMRFPRLWGRVTVEVPMVEVPTAAGPDVFEGMLNADAEGAGRKNEDGDGGRKRTESANGPSGGNVGSATQETLYTVVYYSLLVVGAVGFYKMLYPLTGSSNALVAL
ncbi:hypothetical protein P152DRAFT_456686 [Eremomyces bilateralis CBS 781.70]|uniref:intramembrane prenyl-peptidase Rce1 n=1 Tax=Eremomyces bilateralis CBS 781.70 TaxID=1392243 RepID=A0A6G1G8T5_9PEZI|nr:uncharacterized protein P152DRAFT_456686 [Eremomyces bilateralis CBS 781.70]KAF1814433.1 hypothetical protein P152DRAFT_456686 [Eremomyces bilateralis CBS 781.70]